MHPAEPWMGFPCPNPNFSPFRINLCACEYFQCWLLRNIICPCTFIHDICRFSPHSQFLSCGEIRNSSNFTFLHNYCVDKSEIHLHVEKFQICPHLSCIEIWNFSTWLIFLYKYIGDISDKYQVCAHFHSARSRAGFAGFWKFVKHRFHTLVLVDGAAKKLCLFAALLVGRVRSRATACKMRLQERWCEHTVDLCSERHGCCCRVHYKCCFCRGIDL